MNFSYNVDTELISYTIDLGEKKGCSCFRVSKELVEKIDKTVLDGKKRDDNVLFDKLYEAFYETMYKKYKNFYVDINASNELLKKVHDAYIRRAKVMIEYKEGWESYPTDEELENGAIVSEDGRVHIVRIGRTTGEKPIFIVVENGAYGGESLCFSGIKNIQEIG